MNQRRKERKSTARNSKDDTDKQVADVTPQMLAPSTGEHMTRHRQRNGNGTIMATVCKQRATTTSSTKNLLELTWGAGRLRPPRPRPSESGCSPWRWAARRTTARHHPPPSPAGFVCQVGMWGLNGDDAWAHTGQQQCDGKQARLSRRKGVHLKAQGAPAANRYSCSGCTYTGTLQRYLVLQHGHSQAAAMLQQTVRLGTLCLCRLLL